MKELSQKNRLFVFLTSVSFQPKFSGLIVLGTLVVSIPIIGDAYPHVFHPDEPGILKRPFKHFYQIFKGDFSASLLLYEWLLVIWMGIGFILGLLFQFWSSFKEFSNALVLESGVVIIWGRLLSVVLTSLGHLLLFHFFSSFTSDRRKLALAALCLVFNPFFLPTLFWIKFDAIAYLYSVLTFIFCYRYLILGQSHLQHVIYALGIFALAIRVETVLLPSMVILYDTLRFIRNRERVWQSPKSGWSLAISIGLLFFFTLYPVKWIYQLSAPPSANHLADGINFGEKIILRIFSNSERSNFSILLWDSFSYFSLVLGVILGPIAIGIFVLSTYLTPQIRYFSIYVISLLFVLTIFGVPFFRYSLLPSLIIFNVSLIYLLIDTSKLNQILLLIHTLFFVSCGINYLSFKTFNTDPRLLAKEYVLEQTESKDLIAIETLSAKGFYPPFEECMQEMEEKSKLAKNLSSTGGYAYDILLQNSTESPNCRKLIDICEVNYLSEDPSKNNLFINTYDTLHLATVSPKLYVSSRSPENWSKYYYQFQAFYRHVLSAYPHVKEFSANEGIWDPRVQLMHGRRSIFVYSKKGGS